MDINVALMAVDLAPGIKIRLQAFQPQNAIGDECRGVAFAVMANRLTSFKDRADGFTGAYFFTDPM